jgi:hypothetical protein
MSHNTVLVLFLLCVVEVYDGSQDSSVGIATRHKLDI